MDIFGSAGAGVRAVCEARVSNVPAMALDYNIHHLSIHVLALHRSAPLFVRRPHAAFH